MLATLTEVVEALPCWPSCISTCLYANNMAAARACRQQELRQSHSKIGVAAGGVCRLLLSGVYGGAPPAEARQANRLLWQLDHI